MRDLQKDLEICNKATQGPWYWTPEEIECDPETGWWGEPPSVMLPQVMGDDNGKGFVVWSNDDAEFIAQAREGWPHAIERAIKAEAEVERLTDLLDHYNAKCAICDCADDVTILHTENAKLRKVADVANDGNTFALVQALAELDKEES
jgi:hypothetical protein